MKIPKNLRFIWGARKLASLKQPPLHILIKLDFLNAIFIMPILLAVFNSQLITHNSQPNTQYASSAKAGDL